jgi:hypothetical protein
VTIFLLKLLLVPLLIAAVTWAGGALGPRIAGVLTGFPIVAGPAALVVALEQGTPFASHAAAGTLAAEASLSVFCIVYCRLCGRSPWWQCLLLGWLGFISITLLLRAITPPFVLALLIALASPTIIARFAPTPSGPATKRRPTQSEIALRMLAGAAMVVTLTSLAHVLGPSLSGLLTIFPVATSILAVAAHRQDSPEHAIHLLRGLAAGLYSVTAFFAALALLLERQGIALAFSVALCVAFIAQIAVLGAGHVRQLLRPAS